MTQVSSACVLPAISAGKRQKRKRSKVFPGARDSLLAIPGFRLSPTPTQAEVLFKNTRPVVQTMKGPVETYRPGCPDSIPPYSLPSRTDGNGQCRKQLDILFPVVCKHQLCQCGRVGEIYKNIWCEIKQRCPLHRQGGTQVVTAKVK